jgi:hypothetical protein
MDQPTTKKITMSKGETRRGGREIREEANLEVMIFGLPLTSSLGYKLQPRSK